MFILWFQTSTHERNKSIMMIQFKFDIILIQDYLRKKHC